jgi:citrate lyase beta subunit
MQHNTHNHRFTFEHEPVEFNKYTEKDFLQVCLGATLYMPATKKTAEKIINLEIPHIKSMVMCFEDAIPYHHLYEAEQNAIEHLDKISGQLDSELSIDDVPLIFFRVRDIEQFNKFSSRLSSEQLNVLTGFVFPKLCSANASDYFDLLAELNHRHDLTLYGMPILESKEIAYRETRAEELFQLKCRLDKYQELVLNIRVGGTDFSSLFGVRRGINSSIYDILPVRDTISDILNVFNRAEDGYTVSGPVWEYFLASKEDNIHDYLYENVHRSILTKEPILNDAVDGLLREVVQDKANGMVGKTVIHPSHLKYVNAMQAVTLEEYDDALQIKGESGGVVKSSRANKMNEIGPHQSWANRVILRAQAFGVIKNEQQYIQLF